MNASVHDGLMLFREWLRQNGPDRRVPSWLVRLTGCSFANVAKVLAGEPVGLTVADRFVVATNGDVPYADFLALDKRTAQLLGAKKNRKRKVAS